MLDTKPLLLRDSFPAIQRAELTTLQVNLGYLCNLSCTHCHVNAGPRRTELMTLDTIDTLLQFIDIHGIHTLDVTGGAPEMNPHFTHLVKAARARGITVIDRCNLTILLEPGYTHMAKFLAEQQVHVTASLPCYLEDNVDQQRGNGVFERSIKALQQLNQLGYGHRPELPLDLVYNPTGLSLPPSQAALQEAYQVELKQRYGIVFNQLYTITNMPISRFGSMLLSKGEYDNYMTLLKDNFSHDNLQSVMCKSLISVDWQGYVYDCDFNQMLDMPLQHAAITNVDTIASDALEHTPRLHLSQLLNQSLSDSDIQVAGHCYGCTAGQGSSCGGALNDD